uniref:Uncharacterized protein n=1 Tax=Panagrolaimus superbus TaxID=310955 RepID=A0A914Y7R1_9BILA
MDNIAHLWKVAEDSRRLNQSSNPECRPYRNPNEMLQRWRLRSMESGMNNKMEDFERMLPKTTILSSDIHSCKLSFKELKSIKLCDMEVPMVHNERYLVCQVIAMPSLYVGVTILIQDLNGDVEEVAIYNFSYNFNDLDLLSPGTILIIKEPWLRYGSHDKTPSLRIDSPSDIIFVDPTDHKLLCKIGAKQWFVSMSEDAEVWKQEANECFKKKDYKKALFLYDRAIRYNPDLPVLYLNKSITCLQTGAFYMAYESAKFALEKGGDREKALYRMGQAAYGMREWQKAISHFEEVLKEFPKNSSASEHLKRASARLSEQRTGKFDFKAMFLESKKEKAELDVSDYSGPIEIAEIPGKGTVFFF